MACGPSSQIKLYGTLGALLNVGASFAISNLHLLNVGFENLHLLNVGFENLHLLIVGFDRAGHNMIQLT
jgi:hypothetical protein